MANAIVPQRQKIRGDRLMFSTSDDTAMLSQVQATHAPDGREIEVRLILNVVEDIFNRVFPSISGAIQGAPTPPQVLLDDKAIHVGNNDIMDLLAHTINKMSCEMHCKCSGGGSGDAHTTTLILFHALSSYTWDAKVVLALAAFAVHYGQFWLVAQLYLTNPLAKSVAALKQIPEIMENAASLRPKYDAIIHLITAILNVTKCIIQLKELPAQYISHDLPAYETANSLIPTAAYWTIRSAVACASQIMGLIGVTHEYVSSTTEAWELSSLAHKVNSIFEHLTKQLSLCYQHIEEKKHIEAYQTLVRLFETPHIDNLKILKALIYAKDDQLPLIEGITKNRVPIDVLRRKNVLLLISDLEIPSEELSMLYQIYNVSRESPTKPESQYEVVWIPVVDRSIPWDDTKQKQFEDLQSMMMWHSVYHPSLIDQASIKYIKEAWHFNKKPLLVVLDPQGHVANPNATHMMWIWESQAFPFTSAREEALWRGETWKLELLADSIEPQMFAWISENKYICLYGGEDMDWIRKFTTKARAIAEEAAVPLEMLYVGRSNPKERVRNNNAIISVEGLSHTLDLNLIWFFWVRLESMWHSKIQHGRTVENDPIMQEIVTMLSYDGSSDEGWAVMFRGSADMTKAKGGAFLSCFDKFEEWKVNVETAGLVQAIDEHLHKIQSPHHCNRLILPATTGTVPDKVVCAECGRQMEKFIMYQNSGRENCRSEEATAVLIEAWCERHLRCNRGYGRKNG
ncbi:hypothetical protein V2J09_003858 [Rumex salicifolius]